MKLAGILTYMTMVGSESPKSDKDPQKRIAMLVSYSRKKRTVIILSTNFNIYLGKASSRLGRAKFMPNRRKRTTAWPQVSTRIVFELIYFTRAVV